MAERIVCTLNVQVEDGPKVNETRTISVEAYSKIEVEIANDSVDVTVEVQPGGVGTLKFLLITSDLYGTGLTYSADGGATTVILDQPNLFNGAGAIGIIGSPENLIFNNALAEGTATIGMIVGRDATA